MKKTIWIIEDLPELQSVYESILIKDYQLTFFQSAKDFSISYKNQNSNQKIDLIIIDLMLTDGHFFKTCNEMDLTISTPFLVVSSHDDLANMEEAFDAGAIDYILKPLNFNEIKVKINRHLGMIDQAEKKLAMSIEGLKIDIDKFTNTECKILEQFLKDPEMTINRTEVTEMFWTNSHPNTLDVHIFNLRRKLKGYNYSIASLKQGYFKLFKI
jgi:DNA-binding response OmpR family regulator